MTAAVAALALGSGWGCCFSPERYGPGDGRRVGHDLCGRALGDDVAAVHAGAGPHVDDVIGGEDGLAVVLDDDHAVAEVDQAAQRLEQARVVARVQADRRLVEHVEDADQRGADLRRQADALPFAAGERLRRSIEREVVEPDVDQEAEPRDDGARAAARRWRARAPVKCARPGPASSLEERAQRARAAACRPRRCSCRRAAPRAPRAEAGARRRRRRCA